MRGEQRGSEGLFSYLRLEDRITADHPLRAIRVLVNEALATLSGRFEELYSYTGRPLIAPEYLLRATLLQAFFTVRSERQLMEQIDYNLPFRRFVWLSMDDAVWDASTFSKNRDRLLEADVAREFLATLLSLPRVKRLLSSDHFSVVGTLLKAWAGMKSFRPKDGGGEPPADGRDGERNFRREKRSNKTHTSTTDPDAKLLRLDANLFAFPPQKRKGRGRPPIKGKRHKKLAAMLNDSKVSWQRYRVSLWYGRTNRLVEITSGTALWYRGGVPPVPIRWLLVRDPKGELEPQAFLATDLNARPGDILAWFVSRWQVEVTFEEVRAHLGVETQRQWSDKAILRTTPILLGLFSIVTLWAHDLSKSRRLKPRTAAWYPKAHLTFSDAIAAVRREIWGRQITFMSRPRRDSIEIPRHIWHRMENALAHAA